MQTHEPQSEPEVEAPARRRCRHIFTAGRQCGSPCLRNEQFCYYHHTTRRPVADPKTRLIATSVYDLPNPEDRASVLAAITQIMQAIAHNAIDQRRAGLLLYSLQIALCALPREPKESTMPRTTTAASARSSRYSSPIHHVRAEPPVEEIVDDDQYGLIAPEAWLEEEEEEEAPRRKSLGRMLLDEVEAYEARQAAEEEARQASFKEAADRADSEPAILPAIQACRSSALVPHISNLRCGPTNPSQPMPTHFNPTKASAHNLNPPRQTVDILSSYGRRSTIRPGKLDRTHVVFPPGRLAPE